MKLRAEFADKKRCAICNGPAAMILEVDKSFAAGEEAYRLIPVTRSVRAHEHTRGAHPVEYPVDMGDKQGRVKYETRYILDFTHECRRLEPMEGHPYTPGDPLSYPMGCGALTPEQTRDATSFPKWCYIDEDLPAGDVAEIIRQTRERVTP